MRKIKFVIEEVKAADEISSVSHFKKLRGYETFYRIRLGDYRIGIEIITGEIIFTRLLHRREIYRYFP